MRRIIVITLMLAFIALTFIYEHFWSGRITFGVVADVHKDMMFDADERLGAFTEEMNRSKVDFTIQLGDFCRPYPKNDTFLAVWNSFEGPVYHVLGNHDMDGGFTREQTMAYLGMPGNYYAFDLKGFHFIVLDGNDRTDPPQEGYAHYIGERQKQWLASDLANNENPVVIFSHQSLNDEWMVENGNEIRRLLEEHNMNAEKGRVIACFNGHSHYDAAEEIGGIWYICINSMSYQWLGEEYQYIRYSKALDSLYPWIKYTAPYKDPLYAKVVISGNGKIRIQGTTSEWIGPSPSDLGYPEERKDRMVPWISDRELEY